MVPHDSMHSTKMRCGRGVPSLNGGATGAEDMIHILLGSLQDLGSGIAYRVRRCHRLEVVCDQGPINDTLRGELI